MCAADVSWTRRGCGRFGESCGVFVARVSGGAFSGRFDGMSGDLIAFVDDEESLRTTVGLALRRDGFRVETFADGLQALTHFERSLPDLAILDVVMPRLDGLELCRRLRARSEHLPILILSSKDEELDRVLGLELGADDYLCKPFALRELVARIRALLRRARLRREPRGNDEEQLIVSGALRLDLQRFEASWNDTVAPLTLTEFNLLEALIRRPGVVKSRAQLLAEVYPNDVHVEERTIDTHIKRLRRKLHEAGAEAEVIDTVHGVGYRYKVPR